MPTILVIEDDRFMREDMAELMELEGMSLLQATDGAAGIQLARDRRPDLILCDINLPIKNGYEVYHVLRDDPSTQTIPFLFVTATEVRVVQETLGVERSSVIRKPFKIEELLNAIKQHLA